MSQTKLGSFVESWANIAIGFSLNFGLNMVVFPLLGVPLHASAAFQAGLIFTAVSLVRSYYLRRLFNRIRAWNT